MIQSAQLYKPSIFKLHNKYRGMSRPTYTIGQNVGLVVNIKGY